MSSVIFQFRSIAQCESVNRVITTPLVGVQYLHCQLTVDMRAQVWQTEPMRYTEQTAVRLDEETTEKLKQIAAAEDRSVSQVIRRMVSVAVAAYNLPSAPKPARKPARKPRAAKLAADDVPADNSREVVEPDPLALF